MKRYDYTRMILPRKLLRQCRRTAFRNKLVDSTGASLTGGALLMRSLILRRLMLRMVLSADEQFVGLLLPPTVAGVVANIATTFCRRIAVNLNYTLANTALNHCVRTAGIRHILTSRRFMEKFEFKLDAELVFLEDFAPQVKWSDKLLAACATYAVPSFVLERWLGLTKLRGDDLFTVIFTSGSTGMPKGVMLSFDNIGHNTAAIDRVVQLTDQDVLCGILPFFHSMGYTVNLWSIAALAPRGAYHFNPLEAKPVAKLIRDYGATVLIATPTFLRSYVRRCSKEDFATLNIVVTGAERLPPDLADSFEKQFGIRPVEGYGVTELSPLVSVNVPPNRALDHSASGMREGSVGKPVPGVSVKVVDPETELDLGADQPGLLLVTGPNVMQGYLHQPDATAKAMRDGWYVTGDMAKIDADGFIFITGRQSRFSKIGGEMVPHGTIEEALQRLLGGDDEKLAVAVTGVPDERKGERLVVFYVPSGATPEQLCRELTTAGFPNLWIPSPDGFFQVEQIPVLGTGKLDLQAIKQMAAKLAGSSPMKSK